MIIAGYRIPLFASLLIWGVIWELFGQLGATLVVPPLSAVLDRMVEIVPTKVFASALWITGKAFFAGVLISVLVGVPLGVSMGRSVIIDRLLLPWVNLFLSAPLSSVAFAVWFASDFTSEATTAKPLPASPARAASMVAFSASRLVCSAIS